MSLGLIFNGQGAQFPNMGLDFIQAYEASDAIFEDIEVTTGFNVRTWLEDEFDLLQETRYAQLAVAGVGLAIYSAVKDKVALQVSALAGLSLGEYSALVAGGYLKQGDLWPLLKERGNLMSQACSINQDAGLFAVMDMPLNQVETVIQTLGLQEELRIANYNAPHQYILSGRKADFDLFQKAAKDLKYRKMMPLKVEGAFHSPYMLDIQPQFQAYLERVNFLEGEVPVWSNVTGQPYQEGDLPRLLVDHLVSPVRWLHIMQAWQESGITHMIQIGPGHTLVKLLEKHLPDIETLVINEVGDLDKVEGFIGGIHE